jgi:hypothetical protein
MRGSYFYAVRLAGKTGRAAFLVQAITPTAANSFMAESWDRRRMEGVTSDTGAFGFDNRSMNRCMAGSVVQRVEPMRHVSSFTPRTPRKAHRQIVLKLTGFPFRDLARKSRCRAARLSGNGVSLERSIAISQSPVLLANNCKLYRPESDFQGYGQIACGNLKTKKRDF